MSEIGPADDRSGGVSDSESVPEYVETRPKVWKATDLDGARSIEWLAVGRLPAASVTYMLGPEGIGKSMFLVWLIALVTTGRPFLAFGIPARAPQCAVLVLTEDDWSTVARPRLELAGANLDYVRVICADSDGSGSPTFPRDLDVVAEVAQDSALVIVDAWADTLPGSLTVKDPQHARRALHPWKELATRTGISVLLTGHTNREATGNVRNAYGMTAELRKKARMTLLAQPDPDDDTVLLIGPEKTNLTKPVAASKFRIESVQVFDPSPDSDGTVPRLVWAGDAEHSARDVFTDAAEAAQGEGGDRTEAEAWLEDYLTEQGKAPSKQVKTEAAKEKISERTLKRAAQKLKVVYTTEGFPRISWWALPPQSGHAANHPSESGPTGPTVSDLHKLAGPTERQIQLGHLPEDGPHSGLTAKVDLCGKCGGTLGRSGKCVACIVADASGVPA
ncbi:MULTISPECIES: AAA family ATPase [unclassified Rhodococcus (in: high G+C Gram-positive bacteria)]|uniref:AAA family ATPase n=1 Tax=unclassified Rhodococcus (in: high G+C Gram-positive bacteria) TaxID=192944 RepID=UPI0024B6BFBC|nr:MULTISPECIES: AAA family ATPase [unclassified Rhodococcus (in: high G+C Gram-positive bacteria)]MDI9960316.1 AAA family ATPase [Rhodococcus sp. IEGM 1237]MDI9966172.1 AAA family ATPase [Rhodococcus sp. IEGM 1251]MDV8128434.1 AAA family ATPase [Rhodococcus sp. IEGM 1304]